MLQNLGVLLSNYDCYTSTLCHSSKLTYMNQDKSDSSQVASNWDTYWHGTGDVGAYSSGGITHPAILAFWDEYFGGVKSKYNIPKIIDIASGNGAVVERALAILGDQQSDFTCLDVSEAAIGNIRDRFPQVNGIVSDACDIPLDSGNFDVATSQFGVEYAGLEAISESARLLASGGQIALLLHIKAGSIHSECVQSLDAITKIKNARFIPHAIDMFDAGFKAVRGADRAAYESAAKKLAPAIGVLEESMRQYGQHVAGDTINRLYNEVGQIHQRIQHYEPDEVLDWLKIMDSELDAYAGRMSSMSEAAIDKETFEQVCTELRNKGYTVNRAEPLLIPDHDLPLAWVLIATNSEKVKKTEDNLDTAGREKLNAWIKKQLDTAVRKSMAKDVIDGLIVEAKPAWVLPFQILIGKVRAQGQSGSFEWFICGEVPTDYLASSIATTPRDAAKNFAMKWQLAAERFKQRAEQNPTPPSSEPQQVNPGKQLIDHAEALYGLVEDDRLWLQDS